MRNKFGIMLVMVSVAVLAFGGAIITAYFTIRSFHSRLSLTLPTDTKNDWQWFEVEQLGSRGSLSIDQGALRCECRTSNGRHGSLILTQHSIAPEAGRRYHIAFSAKASSVRRIALTAEQGGWADSGDNIGLAETYLLDGQWAKHDAVFTATGKLGHKVAMPIFGIGAQTGIVWIKDVSVEEIK
jgi:hypothetical protein